MIASYPSQASRDYDTAEDWIGDTDCYYVDLSSDRIPIDIIETIPPPRPATIPEPIKTPQPADPKPRRKRFGRWSEVP